MGHETLATNVIKQCHEFGPKWKKQNMKIKYQKCVLFWFRNFVEHLLCIDCSSQTRTQAWINSSNALFNRRIRASTGCAASPRSRSTRERAKRWLGSSWRRRRQPRPRGRRRVGTVAAATPRRAGRVVLSLSLPHLLVPSRSSSTRQQPPEHAVSATRRARRAPPSARHATPPCPNGSPSTPQPSRPLHRPTAS